LVVGLAEVNSGGSICTLPWSQRFFRLLQLSQARCKCFRLLPKESELEVTNLIMVTGGGGICRGPSSWDLLHVGNKPTIPFRMAIGAGHKS
jgi:hypothetical protein